MIDVANESLITLGDTPKHLPRRPSGKTIHKSTAHRWASRGVRGIVLETIKIGGTIYTSKEAIQRWVKATWPAVKKTPRAAEQRSSSSTKAASPSGRRSAGPGRRAGKRRS